jgi:hypothetical protein
MDGFYEKFFEKTNSIYTTEYEVAKANYDGKEYNDIKIYIGM